MTINRPSKEEILNGVITFLREDLASNIKGPLRFQVLISASLLDIVLREITIDPSEFFKPVDIDLLLGNDIKRGMSVEEKEAILCKKIRRGDFDQGEARKRLFGYLGKELRYKIQVDNPDW